MHKQRGGLFYWLVFVCLKPVQDSRTTPGAVFLKGGQNHIRVVLRNAVQDLFQQILIVRTAGTFGIDSTKKNDLTLNGDHAFIQTLISAVMVEDADQVEKCLGAFLRGSCGFITCNLFRDFLGDESSVPALQRKSDRSSLQSESELIDFVDIVFVQCEHRGADVGFKCYETVLLQTVQCFSERRTADTEIFLNLT